MTALVMYRGDDRAFPLTITEGGTAIDLTDYTVKFTCRTAIDSTDEAISLSSDTVYLTGHEIDIDPDQTTTGAGKVILNIPASATSALSKGTTLLCDIELTDPDGLVRTAPEPDLDQSTLIRLKIRADVTHS